MKNKILFALACVLSAGCMQEYPENENSGNDKPCAQTTYVSNIAVQYSANSIPTKLSANVNGVPVVNECTLGTDNDSYMTVRNGDTVTILLRVSNHAAMYEMFFNADGTPKTNVQFLFSLKGRNTCGETAGQIYSTAQTLDWKPTRATSDKGCADTGYTATVSN